MVFPIVQSVLLKSRFRVWQASELNGWQAVRTAWSWWTFRPAISRNTAIAPNIAGRLTSVGRCCRQVTQADRVRFPPERHRVGRPAGPDQQVGLRPGTLGLDDAQRSGAAIRLGGGAGQDTVTGEQVLDLTSHLHLAAGQHDEVVGDPLQVGERVRGQQHGHAVVGHRRQHRGQELPAGQRVKRGQGLIEDEQPGPSGQRQGQRELGNLATGQPACLLLHRDAELGQPGLCVALVEAPVQVPGQVQHVRGGQCSCTPARPARRRRCRPARPAIRGAGRRAR